MISGSRRDRPLAETSPGRALGPALAFSARPPYLAVGTGEVRVRETFHIELLGERTRGRDAEVVQRRSVREDALAPARDRALDLLRRARAPQWSGPPADAVRVLDGAGTELFLWTATDEVGGARRRGSD